MLSAVYLELDVAVFIHCYVWLHDPSHTYQKWLDCPWPRACSSAHRDTSVLGCRWYHLPHTVCSLIWLSMSLILKQKSEVVSKQDCMGHKVRVSSFILVMSHPTVECPHIGQSQPADSCQHLVYSMWPAEIQVSDKTFQKKNWKKFKLICSDL